MEYLAMNNGVEMPLVGFGTFMLGGENRKNAVAEAIKNAEQTVMQSLANLQIVLHSMPDMPTIPVLNLSI